jgi:hypothetical protein
MIIGIISEAFAEEQAITAKAEDSLPIETQVLFNGLLCVSVCPVFSTPTPLLLLLLLLLLLTGIQGPQQSDRSGEGQVQGFAGRHVPSES